MKVLIVGATGLIGSAAAAELVARGHDIRALALPPLPEGAPLPPMEIHFANYLELSDEELRELFQDVEGFVFAAGVDERVQGPPPIYDFYEKYNITPLNKMLSTAKESGVKHAVVCGSYFSYFAKERPEMRLEYWHPYIRSRRDQEEMALSFADESFSVSILELPYIFGTQPGRKPVWVFLVERILAMGKHTYYPSGGTAMVSIRQVAQAIAGALERGKGAQTWPIGWFNMPWTKFLRIVHRHMGTPKRKIYTVPKWAFQLYALAEERRQKKAGIEGGLHLVRFADLMCSDQFIDKELGCVPLGVEDDDIEEAIGSSIRASLRVIEGEQVLDMPSK
jgi:dihydroflavonol-4-reductase